MRCMRRFIPIKEAIIETGLSEYAIRLGVRQRRFPYTRIGGIKGKILIDIELLEEYLRQEAEDNAVQRNNPEIYQISKIRRVAN